MSLLPTFAVPELDALLPVFAQTAVARDQQGGHAAHEKALLREAGLLNLSVPKAFGGTGLGLKALYQSIRRLAEADSALAHVFAFHHLQVLTVLLYGNANHHQQLLEPTVKQRWWWGNAMNTVDLRLKAEPCAEGYVVTGSKGFCSGTRGSDWMTFSAHVEGAPNALIGVVPTKEVVQLDDWNPIGQRQTDSISVEFHQVLIPHAHVLRSPEAELAPWQTLRNCLAQFVLVNLYLGMAQGALNEGCDFIKHNAFAWITSGVNKRADDPFQQNRIGQLEASLQGALALADRAADILEIAYAKGLALTAEERGEVSIAVAQAKVLAHQVSLSAGNELFEMTGAKGAHQALGLDRFWRNARTHTLHDPIDYKLNQIGRWRLKGEIPDPRYYA